MTGSSGVNLSETLAMSRPRAGTGSGVRATTMQGSEGWLTGVCTCALAFFSQAAGRTPPPGTVRAMNSSPLNSVTIVRPAVPVFFRPLPVFASRCIPQWKRPAHVMRRPFAQLPSQVYACAASFSAITQRVVPKILRLRCPAM